MMDSLLEDKESAERRKNVRVDIKRMWEIYREHIQARYLSQ